MTTISANRAITAAKPRAAATAGTPVQKRPVVGGVDRMVMKAATTGNQVTFHVSPDASHQAILDSIKNSKHSYYIETFIWHNDEAGHAIADALIAKKKAAEAKGQAFDAKVLIDYLGLRNATGSANDLAIVEKLRAGGIEVLEFGKSYFDMSAKGLAKLTPITHRKLYIADGTQFITGGRNIGNEYLKPEYALSTGEKDASWHDLLYTVKGTETGRIIAEFFRNWTRAGGVKPAQLPVVEPVRGGSARVQSVVTDPHVGIYDIRKTHAAAIANAKSEIFAIYPYFSDDALVDQLIAAKKANPALSVKVMMPANKEESREGSIYQLLNDETTSQLLKAGIEVRYFDGGEVKRFSHFKAMIVDNKMLSLGSANGDERTYELNHELNTLIADDKTVADFKKIVDPDWAAARPITADELAGQSLWTQIKRKALELVDFLL